METRSRVAAIAKVSLDCFRNYGTLTIEPAPRFNIVCGENGEGKTNLIEAVMVGATGRILRPGRDVQAIQHGAERSRVSLTLADSGTTLAVEIARGVRKKAFLNEASLPRPSDLLGRLPVVSFTANDLEVVKGEPSARRSFLDTELAQLYPAYLSHLATYKRALEHRNALLKEAQVSHVPEEVFEPWESTLEAQGSQIRCYRKQWVERLGPLVAAEHAQIAGGERLELGYVQHDDGDIASHRQEDVRRGSTSIGPHRDDLGIVVSATDARHFASQGQQRTAVIALKLAVFQTVQEVFGTPPVLLLDDVFSDLDQGRRSRLVTRAIEAGGQVFLTCTEPQHAGLGLIERSNVLRVVSGQVTA